MIEFVKILFCILFLFIASLEDLKTHRVVNRLWINMFILGFPFVIYDLFFIGVPISLYIFNVGFVFVLSYLFFKKGYFGGADVKCILLISLLFPIYPQTSLLPIFKTSLFSFGFITLVNAYVLFVPFVIGRWMRYREIKKEEFAFIPFIKLGFFTSLFLGNLAMIVL